MTHLDSFYPFMSSDSCGLSKESPEQPVSVLDPVLYPSADDEVDAVSLPHEPDTVSDISVEPAPDVSCSPEAVPPVDNGGMPDSAVGEEDESDTDGSEGRSNPESPVLAPAPDTDEVLPAVEQSDELSLPSSLGDDSAHDQSDSSANVVNPTHVATPDIANDAVLRRSHRQRVPPNRLQYSVLGSPLISVVQTLFQSLSDTYTDVLARATVTPKHG